MGDRIRSESANLMALQLGRQSDQDRYFKIIKKALEDGTVLDRQALDDDTYGSRSLWA